MSHNDHPSHEHAGPARVHDEDAVLDIGGDVGALILYTGPELAEREVEIEPLAGGRRVHTAIHERVLGGRRVYAGIYPQLEAGDYRLLTDEAGLLDRVTVVGGEVATVDWRRRR